MPEEFRPRSWVDSCKARRSASLATGRSGVTCAICALRWECECLSAIPTRRLRMLSWLRSSLPKLLAESDFVACLALATEETENMMNEQAFAQMKPGAYFVNASRGNLVDEAALLRALEEGRIAGCAMDVGRASDQMPSPDARAASAGDRHAAHRRAHAAGNRASGLGDRGAGRQKFSRAARRKGPSMRNRQHDWRGCDSG